MDHGRCLLPVKLPVLKQPIRRKGAHANSFITISRPCTHIHGKAAHLQPLRDTSSSDNCSSSGGSSSTPQHQHAARAAVASSSAATETTYIHHTTPLAAAAAHARAYGAAAKARDTECCCSGGPAAAGEPAHRKSTGQQRWQYRGGGLITLATGCARPTALLMRTQQHPHAACWQHVPLLPVGSTYPACCLHVRACAGTVPRWRHHAVHDASQVQPQAVGAAGRLPDH